MERSDRPVVIKGSELTSQGSVQQPLRQFLRKLRQKFRIKRFVGYFNKDAVYIERESPKGVSYKQLLVACPVSNHATLSISYDVWIDACQTLTDNVQGAINVK